ncbi:MAG: translation elongation factor 4 [Acidobacteria bacterium]|nr:translation elongation factor 4 [Acidobacteriota bacterium]MCA1610841.1 translation elongation factor 4 [Acidobacteriota bacterium]
MPDPGRIRNFSIVAHIDHGKTTLSDRILQRCGAVSAREMHEQMLDDMELEQERGITIKARSVTLRYVAKDGLEYTLNLIDTPGHVDFSYEVSRSLAACEGAVLVVDATQGVEAQTLANAYLAIHNNLVIVPVINKIDLPSAEPERAREQIEQVVGIPADDAILTSAKQGIGIEELLERIVRDVPPPRGNPDAPLKALLFDSWYDPYRGVTSLVRIIDGKLEPRTKIRAIGTGLEAEVEEVGVFRPERETVPRLSVGEVGSFWANIKDLHWTRIGDTITEVNRPTAGALEGFAEAKPMVFAGLFPTDADDYGNLREAMDKLRLNDASFTFEPENSTALGFGFRCGFLGLLHMEIVQERLEREFDLDLITTAPGVSYRVITTGGEILEVANPNHLPPPNHIEKMEEPYISSTIITRDDFLGGLLKLSEDRRGVQKSLEYLSSNRVVLTYEFPLNEVVLDFYDKLKSISKGYASFDYEFIGYREGDLVKLDILVNGEPVDALSLIVHREESAPKGRLLAAKMKEIIPRQMFEVIIQAAIGSKIIARETVSAIRKNVIAKCYGGDITRKRKLLEKQKEGKKRMKRVGRVDIPQEAFLAVLKVE